MPTNPEIREQQALINSIVRYEEFTRAVYCADLVMVLWEHREEEDGLRAEDLAELIYKGKSTKDAKTSKATKDDANNPPDSQRSMRVLCGEVRRKLWRYSGSDEGMSQKWCCVLPEATRGMGYKLQFINQWGLPGLSGAFWQAHRDDGRRPIIVYSEPLFFRDEAVTRVFRWFDVNLDETTRDDALQMLKSKHQEVKTEELYPSYQYVLSGETNARQAIREWFDDAAGMRVEEHNGRRINSSVISATSPILLGNPHSNRMMRHLLNSAQGKQGKYQVDSEGFGKTSVVGVTDPEELAIARVTGKKIEKGGPITELVDSLGADSYLFGVVTRMPNPYGDGVVTLISAHQTRAVEQMARTLVTDKRLQKLQAFGWPSEKPFPGFFQALFAIRVGPVNVDMEAREPELIGFRSYSD